MAVMLIEAPTGMGKTFLVKRMRHHTQIESQLPIVHIDFRERRAHDTLWLVRYIRDQLSKIVPPYIFDDLTTTINQYTTPATPVSSLRTTMKKLLLTLEGQPLEVSVDLVAIRQNLNEFGVTEIRTITFDLGLKFDDLIGENLAAKVIDLIDRCERFKLLDQLVLWGAGELPHLVWWEELVPEPAAAQSTAADASPEDHGGDLQASSQQARQLAIKQINRAFSSCLRRVLDSHRLVLLFDSFEDATDEAEAWIHDQLLVPMFDNRFENLLVIVSGRQTYDIRDRKPLVGKTGLDPFSLDDVREYLLEKRNIQEDDIEKVFKYSRGLPSVLATMADVASMTSEDEDDW